MTDAPQTPDLNAELGAEPLLTDEQYQAQVREILHTYHQRQLMLHLIGPLISLVVHVFVLTGVAVLWEGSSQVQLAAYTVKTIEMPTKELSKELLEELDRVDEQPMEAEAPAVEVAEVPVAEVAVDTGAADMVDASALGGTDLMSAEAAIVDIASTTTTTPLKLSGLMVMRSADRRATAVARGRGSQMGQTAVLKALKWLQSKQNPDGSWGKGAPQARTGLVLLTFLAHGETPLSEQFGPSVQRGMQWLATNVMTRGASIENAYSHGIATYALSEAYAMTQIPFLRTSMEKGIDVIVEGQQPGGGFDYNYAKGERWDLSVSGWQFQAMKAAKAAGSAHPKLDRAIDRSVDFLRKKAYKNKKFGYASAGGGGNMTGVGAVALQLLGERNSAEVKGSLETIGTERIELYRAIQQGKQEWKKGGGSYIYGFYYDTQAVFNAEGKEWREWSKVFEDVLVKNQNPAGYWETDGHVGGPDDDGRILSTTLCALQLEVYYRYLPTFDVTKMQKASGGKSITERTTSIIIE